MQESVSLAVPLRMTVVERRASLSLASVYAMRMLSLFLVLPVFVLEAAKYPGGSDAAMVGLAMGVAGLTQALFQLPFGMASDKLGRKRVILFGLAVFAVGSLVATLAPNIMWLIVGRALQGMGAISAAVSALLADLTRDAVRTKAMALTGISIGLTFAVSLVLAPLLVQHMGLSGLFGLTVFLTLVGMAVVQWWVPQEPQKHQLPPPRALQQVLKMPALLRLNVGVFVLHTVQIAMWVTVPSMLVAAGLPKALHWHVYLPVVLGSFVVMGLTLFPLERRGHLRLAFLGAIVMIMVAQLGLLWLSQQSSTASNMPSIGALALCLFIFFCGFNALEASQPSLASRLAPLTLRGTALGVYNTTQALGIFVGGWGGGLLIKDGRPSHLFASCAALLGLWLLVAWGMQAPVDNGRT